MEALRQAGTCGCLGAQGEGLAREGDRSGAEQAESRAIGEELSRKEQAGRHKEAALQGRLGWVLALGTNFWSNKSI